MLNPKTNAVMEMLNNVKMSVNFNLREPKKVNGRTNLYCVVKVGERQIKIPLGSINAWSWDKRKQIPIVLQSMTEQERTNNIMLNKKIFEVKCRYYGIIDYLCTENKSDKTEIENLFRTELSYTNQTYDMANYNAIPPKRSRTATKIIQEGFEMLYGTKESPKCKESSWRNYNISKNAFLDYIKENDNVYDSINTLSQKGMNAYRNYLEGIARKKGEGTTNTIVERCNLIIRIINELARNEKYDIKRVEMFKKKHTIKKEDAKRQALTKEEVSAVMKCETLTDEENVYRDIFEMQLESGVRFSDLGKLFSCEYVQDKKDGVTTQTIETQKEGITAVIIVNERIRSLQDKYSGGLPFKLRENKYNQALKAIFEISGLTGNKKYYVDFLGTKKEKNERLCDIITNHFLRHTFITNKVLEGWDCETLCHCTGHTDDKMIKQIYSHLSQNDKINKVVKEYKRVGSKKDVRDSQGETKTDSLNALFAYDYIKTIEEMNTKGIDAFNQEISRKAIKIIKDTESINKYTNVDSEKAKEIDETIFKMTYRTGDSDLYLIYQFKLKKMGIIEESVTPNDLNQMIIQYEHYIYSDEYIREMEVREYENSLPDSK